MKNAEGRWSLLTLVGGLINVGWYGALILLVLCGCLLAVTPWVDPPRIEVGLALPAAFQVEPEAHPVTATSPGAQNVYLSDGLGSLRFSPRRRAEVAAAALALIAAVALVLWIIGHLRVVLRSVREGHPFAAANAGRIRRIAWGVVLGELVRAVLNYTATTWATSHFSFQGIRFEARWEIHTVTILCGLMVFLIAEVFREGTRLNDEQSLTV